MTKFTEIATEGDQDQAVISPDFHGYWAEHH